MIRIEDINSNKITWNYTFLLLDHTPSVVIYLIN